MEVILLSAAGLVVLLLALFGAFCCVRRIFFRKRPLSLRPAETEGQMARKDKPESAALIPGDAAPAARPDAADGENARPPSGLRQRPISAESLPPGSPLSRFAIVAAIALALLIPLLLVQNLVDERASLYRNVVQDISRTWGGQQQLTGPMLLIPYTERQITRRRGPGKEATGGGNQGDETITESHWALGHFVLLPTRVDFSGGMVPQERRRGIYRSLVYTADLHLAGRFTLPPDDALKRAAPALESVNYAGAYVVMGLSYPNALRTVGPLVWNKAELNAEPGIQPFSKLKNGFRIPVRLSPEIREYTFAFVADKHENLLFKPQRISHREKFFWRSCDDADLVIIVKAHQAEQAFGIGLTAVGIYDLNVDTFLSNSLQALALGEVIDLSNKIILATHTGSPLSAKNCLRRVMMS